MPEQLGSNGEILYPQPSEAKDVTLPGEQPLAVPLKKGPLETIPGGAVEASSEEELNSSLGSEGPAAETTSPVEEGSVDLENILQQIQQTRNSVKDRSDDPLSALSEVLWA